MDGVLKKVDGLSLQDKPTLEWKRVWDTKPEKYLDYKKELKASGLATIIYDPQKDGAIEEWKGFKPSQIKMKEDGIKAVRVMRPGMSRDKVKTVSQEDLDKVLAEFYASTSGAKTVEYLAGLAKKYKFTTGNWTRKKIVTNLSLTCSFFS
jgi:hypothetical protein